MVTGNSVNVSTQQLVEINKDFFSGNEGKETFSSLLSVSELWHGNVLPLIGNQELGGK